MVKFSKIGYGSMLIKMCKTRKDLKLIQNVRCDPLSLGLVYNEKQTKRVDQSWTHIASQIKIWNCVKMYTADKQ